MARQDVTIYHNPRCSTSRAVLKMLQDEGIEPKVVLYLENPPSEKELSAILKQAGLKPLELMRRKEPIAKELGIGTKDYSDAQLIKLMVKHPILIERPVVIAGKKAVLARPAERASQIL
jgi:arsenate reductase